VKKYFHVMATGIQNSMAYRFHFFTRTFLGFIPVVAVLYVWRTVYEGKDVKEVGVYTFGQMVSYYLLVTIVDALTAVNEDDWQIASDIRDGAISQFLLKPINYLTYRLALFVSGRAVYFIFAAIPLALFIFILRKHFQPPPDFETFCLFCVSVALTALLQFFTSYVMALLAFWLLEVSTFIFIVYAFEYIASGHLFPLDILPASLQHALAFTPFPYQLYFPVSIYLGKTTGTELWQGLGIQFFWVALSYGLAKFVWNRGIRKYAAYGG
jgi:ABC-2 type transport system permease protein